MLRRLLMLLFLLLVCAAPALSEDSLPEAIERDVLARFEPFGSKGIEAYCLTWKGDYIVLMRSENDFLSLCAYGSAPVSGWTCRWENHRLNLRAESPVTLTAHEERFPGWRSGRMLPPGFTIDTGAEQLVFSWSDEQSDYLLAEYASSGERRVHCEYVESNGYIPLAYYENADWTALRAVMRYDGFARHAQWLCLSTVVGARIDPYFIDETPKFSLPETGLSVVSLIGSDVFPVYSGPGTDYHRAAGDKAAVSAVDSFGVLGKTGEWLMVVYDISGKRARVGYIRYTGDARLEEIAELTREIDFSHIRNVFTTQKRPLWDDPIHRTSPLCTLPENTGVVYLMRCGDLAYVEATVNGRRMRGFVEDDCLGNG